MSNITSLRGVCPAPFFEESSFPPTGGYVAGRFCAGLSGGVGNLRCCMPCPATDWVYPNNFYSLTRIPGYVNIAGLALCLFMLISFLVLPLEKTRRQYLNVCLIISIVLLEAGFIVPLLRRPQTCYNEITPNDMYTSMTCAWGGAMVIAGGAAINSWILIRAFSMHLQIVWDIVPGTVFFYVAQVFGWGLAAVLTATCLAITGVSYRFGDYCHINHHDSIQTFWGPILGFAGVSVLLQLWTFMYCLKVYLKNLYGHQKQDSGGTQNTSNLSQKAAKARAVYHRVMKVLNLQWRGLLIVVVVLTNVIYFATVFILLDSEEAAALHNIEKILPWVLCMIQSKGNKNKCYSVGTGIGVNEATLIATLMLVGIIGIEAWLLIARLEMITGWFHLWSGKSKNDEFISVDARRGINEKGTYDNLKLSTADTSVASPEMNSISNPEPRHMSPLSQAEKMEFFGTVVEREYRSPATSYSSPTTPLARSSTIDRDSRPTTAKSGVGQYPSIHNYSDWV